MSWEVILEFEGRSEFAVVEGFLDEGDQKYEFIF
jgi:hypothetical protein